MSDCSILSCTCKSQEYEYDCRLGRNHVCQAEHDDKGIHKAQCGVQQLLIVRRAAREID